MSKKTTTTSGITLCGAVFIVFLILKLAEVGKVAAWSWWWVTAPLWMPVAVVLAILLIALIVMIIVEFSRKRR